MEQVILHIVRDDGLEFDIDNVVWMIPNDGLENWANLPHSVSVQENASYDGGVVTNKRIETVDRSVHAELANPADNAAKRLEAIRFFSRGTRTRRTLRIRGARCGALASSTRSSARRATSTSR